MSEKDVLFPRHRFILSNHNSSVIRCCIHCGLSHFLGTGQGTQQFDKVWNLIREEEGDTSFSEECPAESGSDASLFSHHHFTLNSSQWNVIRFCIHCGLSHIWATDPRDRIQERRWRCIRANERDMTLSGPCAGKPESNEFRQRYEAIPWYSL